MDPPDGFSKEQSKKLFTHSTSALICRRGSGLYLSGRLYSLNVFLRRVNTGGAVRGQYWNSSAYNSPREIGNAQPHAACASTLAWHKWMLSTNPPHSKAGDPFNLSSRLLGQRNKDSRILAFGALVRDQFADVAYAVGGDGMLVAEGG